MALDEFEGAESDAYTTAAVDDIGIDNENATTSCDMSSSDEQLDNDALASAREELKDALCSLGAAVYDDTKDDPAEVAKYSWLYDAVKAADEKIQQALETTSADEEAPASAGDNGAEAAVEEPQPEAAAEEPQPEAAAEESQSDVAAEPQPEAAAADIEPQPEAAAEELAADEKPYDPSADKTQLITVLDEAPRRERRIVPAGETPQPLAAAAVVEPQVAATVEPQSASASEPSQPEAPAPAAQPVDAEAGYTPQPAFQQQPAAGTCPKCGTPAMPGDKFCSVCGTKLEAAPAAVPNDVCPNCGAKHAPGDKFCIVCGSKLDATTVTPQPMPAASIVCPNCGAEHAPEDTFCMYCGYKLK